MKKLGIRFSDNDFGNTFRALLETMEREGLDQYPTNREELAKLINKALPGIYWISQNRGRYETKCDIVSYLKIDPEDLYIDSEIDLFLKENEGWDNGEFHVLSTFVPTSICSY